LGQNDNIFLRFSSLIDEIASAVSAIYTFVYRVISPETKLTLHNTGYGFLPFAAGNDISPDHSSQEHDVFLKV